MNIVNQPPVEAPDATASKPNAALRIPTDEEKKIVQDTFKLVEPNAAGVAERFYNRLFEIKPE
ncbi:MAG: hypothetical protein IIC06_08720, partial [Proteobacteria bacterium]|nr:hypothetical protein [Pseudomonadota bacterium]